MTEPSRSDVWSEEGAQWDEVIGILRSYVAKRVPADSVDDVVAEIMLKLVEHRDGFDAAMNPVAWVRRVAANTIADRYRRREAERKAIAQMEVNAEIEAAAEEEPSSFGDIARCIEPFMRRLPPPYGEALRLTEFEGLSQADAAKRAGLSVSGMKSRVQRGRRKLKEALQNCCDFDLDVRGRIMDHRRRAP